MHSVLANVCAVPMVCVCYASVPVLEVKVLRRVGLTKMNKMYL